MHPPVKVVIHNSDADSNGYHRVGWNGIEPGKVYDVTVDRVAVNPPTGVPACHVIVENHTGQNMIDSAYFSQSTPIPNAVCTSAEVPIFNSKPITYRVSRDWFNDHGIRVRFINTSDLSQDVSASYRIVLSFTEVCDCMH